MTATVSGVGAVQVMEKSHRGVLVCEYGGLIRYVHISQKKLGGEVSFQVAGVVPPEELEGRRLRDLDKETLSSIRAGTARSLDLVYTPSSVR